MCILRGVRASTEPRNVRHRQVSNPQPPAEADPYPNARSLHPSIEVSPGHICASVLFNWHSYLSERSDLHQSCADLMRRWPCRSGHVGQFRQEKFVGCDTIYSLPVSRRTALNSVSCLLL